MTCHLNLQWAFFQDPLPRIFANERYYPVTSWLTLNARLLLLFKEEGVAQWIECQSTEQRVRGSTPVEPQSDIKNWSQRCVLSRLTFCVQMQAAAVGNTLSIEKDVKWRSHLKEKHTLWTLKNPSHSIVKSKLNTRCCGTPAFTRTPSAGPLGRAVSTLYCMKWLPAVKKTGTNKQTNKQTLCWNSYLFTPGLPGLLEIMAEKDRRTTPKLAEMKTDFTLSESTRFNGRKDWNGYNHGNKDVGYTYNNG